jgi:hypothetical protein
MPPERPLIVTTRSRLRGVRFFPRMLRASSRISRQLAATDGIVRWASVVAGPTEFWTITVWHSRHALQEFMRSDAHGEIMWQVGHWLRSFWLLRWRPGPEEIGAWDGQALAAPPGPTARTAPDRTGTAAAAVGLPAEAVLGGIPELLAAMGGDRAAAYDSAPMVRRQRASVEGLDGAVVRIRCRPARTPAALLDLRRLAGRLGTDPDTVRVVVGTARLGEVYLLAVWSRPGCAGLLLDSDWPRSAAARWGEGLWAAGWRPESEFGSWDGLRLRRLRHRRPDAGAAERGSGRAAAQRSAGGPRRRAARRRGG